MKSGRPSYASVGRKHGELSYKSNRAALKWLNRQIEALNPGEGFEIPPATRDNLIESSVRSYLAVTNRKKPLNIKLHKDRKTGSWYIWYCPFPDARITRSGNVYSPLNIPDIDTLTNTPITPIKPKVKRSPNSIHFPDAVICQRLGITIEKLNSYTFDYAMDLRIKTGIKLKNELQAKSKLNQIFASDTNTPDTNTSN
jgi:hypothetical protein